MYIDNYRSTDEEDLCFYDPNRIYQLETQNLPAQCPYRQMLSPSQFRFQAPTSPPPNFTPSEAQVQQYGATTFVEQGAISPCVFRFVYIWPRRGNGFWAWLTFVGRRSTSGFRWTGRSWRYFGMNLKDIRSFQCF